MENASKALLMAAGVLIGILILSLAVFLFANFGSASAEINRQNEIKRINEFNAQFTVFEGKECTIHDIISVANLAINNNSNYFLTSKGSNNYYISVNIKTEQQNLQESLKGNDGKINNEEVNKLIIKDTNNLVNYTDSDGNTQISLPRYTCKVEVNGNTQRVQTVNFTKIKK